MISKLSAARDRLLDAICASLQPAAAATATASIANIPRMRFMALSSQISERATACVSSMRPLSPKLNIGGDRTIADAPL